MYLKKACGVKNFEIFCTSRMVFNQTIIFFDQTIKLVLLLARAFFTFEYFEIEIPTFKFFIYNNQVVLQH